MWQIESCLHVIDYYASPKFHSRKTRNPSTSDLATEAKLVHSVTVINSPPSGAGEGRNFGAPVRLGSPEVRPYFRPNISNFSVPFFEPGARFSKVPVTYRAR